MENISHAHKYNDRLNNRKRYVPNKTEVNWVRNAFILAYLRNLVDLYCHK